MPSRRADSRRRTRPTPLTRCVTCGSPAYSTFPAPEIDAFSVFCALTTTLPAPLTDTVAFSLVSFSASTSPAPEIATSWSTTRPASVAFNAPAPDKRSVRACRSSMRTTVPPEAEMRSASASSFAAESLTAPASTIASSVRNVTVIRGRTPLRPPPRMECHHLRVSPPVTCSVPSLTRVRTRL